MNPLIVSSCSRRRSAKTKAKILTRILHLSWLLMYKLIIVFFGGSTKTAQLLTMKIHELSLVEVVTLFGDFHDVFIAELLIETLEPIWSVAMSKKFHLSIQIRWRSYRKWYFLLFSSKSPVELSVIYSFASKKNYREREKQVQSVIPVSRQTKRISFYTWMRRIFMCSTWPITPKIHALRCFLSFSYRDGDVLSLSLRLELESSLSPWATTIFVVRIIFPSGMILSSLPVLPNLPSWAIVSSSWSWTVMQVSLRPCPCSIFRSHDFNG